MHGPLHTKNNLNYPSIPHSSLITITTLVSSFSVSFCPLHFDLCTLCMDPSTQKTTSTIPPPPFITHHYFMQPQQNQYYNPSKGYKSQFLPLYPSPRLSPLFSTFHPCRGIQAPFFLLVSLPLFSHSSFLTHHSHFSPMPNFVSKAESKPSPPKSLSIRKAPSRTMQTT